MLQTDPEDRELTESIVNEFSFSVPLKFLAEAEEIDNYTAAVGFPSLLLVSDSSRGMAVNLVKKMKSKAAYSHIPVIILAERSLNSYAKDCYRAGANSFVIKPSTLEETRKKIELFFKYWFEVAEL